MTTLQDLMHPEPPIPGNWPPVSASHDWFSGLNDWLQATPTPGGETVLLILGAIVLAYLFPFIVAVSRGKNPGGVLILNLVIGWTVVGWIIALVMACGQTERRVYGPRKGGLVQVLTQEMAERRLEREEIAADEAWHAARREPRL
jgi:hypothetical protein